MFLFPSVHVETCVLEWRPSVFPDGVLHLCQPSPELKQTDPSLYPKKVIHAEGQIAARGEGVHHEVAVHVQAECIREKKQDATVCNLGIWSSDVCFNTIYLLCLSLWLPGVNGTF